MGVFKHCVFGAPNPCNSSFFGAPTFTVPPEAGAPGTAPDGLPSVLISNFANHDAVFRARTMAK